MKQVIIVALIIVLAGCQKQAETVQTAGSGGFAIEKLFTVDGCSVYRFFDNKTVYFTNCSGQTSTTESCGKGCVRDANVSGGRP